jgi:hypothetical protein
MTQPTTLFPRRICETQSGNLAYSVGRLAFRPGRPMLVEHVGGFYLEHDLSGRVLHKGHGAEFNVTHVWAEDVFYPEPVARVVQGASGKVFTRICSHYEHSTR